MLDKNVEGFALSPQQEHLWQVQKTATVGPYRSWSVYRIEGRLDVAALESALNETVLRHEILRTAFLRFHGLQLPLQVITPPRALTLRCCDSKDLALEARTGNFALERGDVLSASLATLSPTEHLLALSLPGLCADATTLDNLLREIAETYHGQTAGGIPEEPLQYVDVVQFFRQLLDSEEAEAGKEHWRRHTAQGSAKARLPLEEKQPGEDGFTPGVVERALEAGVFHHVETVGHQLKVGADVLFFHCWQILLRRITGLPDLTVAAAVDGRGHEGLQEALGLFARHLPVPVEAAEDISFTQSIQRTRSSVLAAQRWQETFSWPLVMRSLDEESVPGYWPFCFEFRKAFAGFAKNGLSFSLLATEAFWDRFKLKLVLLQQDDDGLIARFEYDRSCLSSMQVERLAAAFEGMLQTCLERPDTRVSELPIVGRDEWRHLVFACNDTRVEHPSGERLHAPFETQAEQTPDAVAVALGEQQMTYRELNRRATQLAHWLHGLGVGPESMVAIHLDRSFAMVESILAVLKAGGAYVPLDPDYPRERLASILEDAGASVLLTEKSRAFELPAAATGVTILDVRQGTRPGQIEGPPRVEATDASLAYVIYTSGSTGRPKGVMVTHQAIVNRLRWMQREFPLAPADRVLQKTPYGFDASIWELFSPLWAGARLILAEPGAHRDSARMVELIVTQGVTRLQLVPSLLGVFLDEPRLGECRSLEHLFCGGEALLGEWRERVFERLGCRLTNLYGPTEAAIDASFHSCRQGTGEGIEPIGRPLDNVQIYLLGPEMQCVATGMAGHLHIGGAGLARGYHGRPDLTAQRFLPDFLSGAPGGRLYATGDLARQREDGTIEYLGRIDHQVKIHGVRIELGEIEAVLSAHPGVQDAVVVPHTGESGALRLAAYAVPLRQQSLERFETLALPNGLEVAYLNRNETQTIYREIFEDLTYLRHGIELPDGACVFDVGANIGLFTLFVHQSCRNPQVFAFEPIPPTFDRLRRNVELYGLNVELFDCGVGSSPGNATFTFYRSWSGMSGMHADRAEDEAMTRTLLNNQDRALGENADQLLEGRFETELFSCRLTTLSEAIARHRIERIDLLKVDVEKSELAVLAGLAENDWGKIRQIVLEVHDRSGELETLTGLLHGHGFELVVEQDAWLTGSSLYNVYAVHRGAGGLKPKRELGGPRHLDLVATKPPSAGDLRDYLRTRLPEPMVPAHVVILDALPRMANGKVDRKALPAPEQPGARETYMAPRTREEKLLAEVWAQVLRLPRVGVNDNFFELGGDSILSIQIVIRARQAGLLFTVRQVFQHQTLAELARHATVEDAVGAARAGQVLVAGEVPLTPMQSWFFEQGFADPQHFNQAIQLESREALSPSALDRAMAALVEHHDVLRMRFQDGRQEIAPAEPATPFYQIDLSSLPSPRRLGALEQATAALQAGFDLSSGPLTRLCLFQAGTEQSARLLWITHHLLVDGVSWRVLVDDLEGAYRQAVRGQRVSLPPKTTSFQEWAHRLAGHASSDALARELDHWCETARAAVPRLPVDFSSNGGTTADNLVGDEASVSFELSSEETADLLQTLPAVYHSRIDDALLSALVRALADWTGSSSLRVDLEGHGREPLFDDLDVSRTVGWFTTMYPIVLEAGDAGPGDALVSAKERLRVLPGRGIGYGLLRYLGDASEHAGGEAARLLKAAPAAEISFNYLGQFDAVFDEHSLFRFSHAPGGSMRSLRAHRPHLLEISGIVIHGRLRMTLNYGARTHRRETVERLAAAYAGALRQLIRHSRESEEVFTPSDFPKAGLDAQSFTKLASLLSDPSEPMESLAGGLGLTLKNISDVYPLTPLQGGMLFHSLMAPESGVYFNQVTCTLPADLDSRLFRQTWEKLIERHGTLRTAFFWDGLAEPLQVVRKNVSLPWQVLDWRGLSAEEEQRRFEELRHHDRYTPLPLNKAPLMRFSLVRLDREHRFIWTSHHLLMDGWSFPLLVQELGSVHAALREGRTPELPPAQPFGGYISWLHGQDATRAEPFWREELAGFTAPNSLRIAHPAEGAGASGYTEHKARVSREVTERLQALAARHRLTLQSVTLGAWAVLVSRYSCQEDVVFGSVVSGRPAILTGIETMIGMFINTLPVRARVDGAELLAPWLQRLQERDLARREFEHSPLARIQRWSEIPAGSPLFETLYVFENYPAPRGGGSGSLRIGNFHLLETTNYPITLLLAAADQITLRLIYDPAYIDEETAPRLLHHLSTLLTAMAEGPEAVHLDDLRLLTPEEALQLRVGAEASYPVDRPLHDWVEDHAGRSPDAVAVTFETDALTYRELDRRANRLARHLRALGVRPETRVAVLMERSAEMVIALLAILKAGGAYVPLDLAYPAERITFLLADSAAAVLLTEGDLAEALPAVPGRIVRIDADRERIAALPADGLAGAYEPAHLAYVIYTSGSTGRPKGVQVTHANVLRLFAATQQRFGLGTADAWTFFHSVAFDFSVWEIWGALLHGGRLVIVSHETSRSPWQFLDLLIREQVTILNQTPSAFAQLAQEDGSRGGAGSGLRLVIFGGEALDIAGLAPWLERHGDETPQLVNMYGITETTVHVTARPVSWMDALHERRSLIGLPISDLSLTLMDPGLRPVPRGVPGELAVGGAGLARGYLGRPELTAERFVPDPLGERPGARLYRSGDLGRLLVNGDVEYLGRIDHQVKIRGFRIELGEIEAALEAHPKVREAVVVALGGLGPADRRLVAYLVAEDEAPPVDELRRVAAARLPDYMVPAAFVALEAFPLTPHGKVDRKALPKPGTDRPDLAQPFVAPATPEEEAWVEVWQEVLGVDRIGIEDSFFALGGDSIRTIQVLARARERGLNATLQEIYQHQTIRSLLEGQAAAPAAPAAEIQPFGLLTPGQREHLPAGIEDAYPLTLLQAGMVFHSEYSPETSVFHDVASYHIRSPLDLEALRGAVRELAGRHAVLRTSFLLNGPGDPLQLVHQNVEIPVDATDLRPLALADQGAVLAAWIEEERRQGFDWARPPLLRFHVHRRSDDSHQLTLSLHHALLDGWSLATFFSELFQEHNFRLGLGPAPDAGLRSTFRDFVALEREALASPEQREFWQRDLAGCTATLLPRWTRPAGNGVRRVRKHYAQISAETSEGLQQLASSLGVPVKSALLAAHLRVLQVLTGQVDLVTGLIANGRPEERDGERVLGLFLNTVPFRSSLRGGTWRELVRQTFAAESERLPFRRFPMAEIQRMHGGQPLFETVFNFVSFHVYASTDGLLDMEILDAEAVEETNFPLGASFGQHPVSSRLQLALDCGTAELAPEQAEAIAGYYERTLAAMVATPDRRFEDVVLLAPEEIQVIVAEANVTHAERPGLCVHELFEAQAARSPAQTALILGDGRLSYRELNEWADRLARRLRGLGVGPETVVGLCAERSFEAIAGILGVLKAGGAYLPLDPAYPPERLSYLLEDARVPVLLCQERLLGRIPAHGAHVVLLDDVAPEEHEPRTLGGGATPLHPAYVIYTSGSTGLPKGVVALHEGLASFALAMAEEIGLGPSHRFLEFASLSFDASAVQIFPTLLSGATLVLHPDPTSLASHEILHLCERHEVTVLDLPAALWRQFVDDVSTDRLGKAPVSVFMTGGESVAVARLRSWAEAAPPGALFLSSYGPTEATVTTTMFTVTRERVGELDGRLVPLGRCLPGVRVHLLDRHLTPVPLSVPGEVCIGGVGITRGYLGRPDLTAQAFVPDPFAGEPGARLYRTGDMARRLQGSHELEFLGRFDHQVKVRSFRVEPGEIEAVLATWPEVSQAVVIPREDTPGDVRLAAYLVPAPEREIDRRALRSALQKQLPSHMVPAAFMVLDALPVTTHGKLDREALPVPDGTGLDADRPYRAPRTPVELALAQAWSETLKVERIGLDDSFLELGGHSLIAIQMIGRLRETFRVDLPLRVLYEAETLAELAEAIEQLRKEGAEAAASSPGVLPPLQPDPAGRFLPFPLTPVQQVYWAGQSELFELGGGGSNVYTELEVSGLPHVFLTRLKAALPRWIERHEMLRAVVLPDGRQQILERVPRYVPKVVDLRGQDPGEALDRLDAARGRLRFAQAVPGEWPLFDIVLFRLDGDRLRICSRISALLLDGTSREIMMQDLFRLLSDPDATFSPPDVSFRDYALAREGLRGTEAGRRARDFWMQRLPGLPPAPDLPRVREEMLPARPRFVFRDLELLDAETWERLRHRAARSGLTPTGAVLAAFVDTLASFARTPCFTLSLIGSERFPFHPQIDRLGGNFNTVHLLEVDGWDGPFEARARRLRDRLAADLEFPYFSGLEVLRALNRLHGNRFGAAMPVLFNSVIEYNETHEDQPADAPEPAIAGSIGGAIDVRNVELNIYTPQVLFSPTVMEGGDGRLLSKWQAVEDAFPPGLIVDMAAAFERRLRDLAGREESWQAAPPPRVEQPEAPERRNPLDAEEEEVATLWRDLLGTGDFGMRDDFFAAGGDSFGVVRLIAGLEERVAPRPVRRRAAAGRDLAAARALLRERLMAAFVQEATVENLAAVVRRERAARAADAAELAPASPSPDLLPLLEAEPSPSLA